MQIQTAHSGGEGDNIYFLIVFIFTVVVKSAKKCVSETFVCKHSEREGERVHSRGVFDSLVLVHRGYQIVTKTNTGIEPFIPILLFRTRGFSSSFQRKRGHTNPAKGSLHKPKENNRRRSRRTQLNRRPERQTSTKQRKTPRQI